MLNAARGALPRAAYEAAARSVLRAVGGGLLELLRGEGFPAFNAFAAQRLANDVARLQQLAAATDIPGLAVRAVVQTQDRNKGWGIGACQSCCAVRVFRRLAIMPRAPPMTSPACSSSLRCPQARIALVVFVNRLGSGCALLAAGCGSCKEAETESLECYVSMPMGRFTAINLSGTVLRSFI